MQSAEWSKKEHKDISFCVSLLKDEEKGKFGKEDL